MSAGSSVDAWLLRHGAWFMPGVLALFGLATGAVLVWGRAAAIETPMTVLPHAAAAAPERRGTPVPPADPPSMRAVAELAPAGAAGARDDRVEVCAIGWVGIDGSGGADLAAIAAAPAIERPRRDLLRAARGSRDEFLRAVAVGLGADDVVPQVASTRPTSAAPATLPSAAAVERLAGLAPTAADPRIYAMAYRRCAAQDAPGPACRGLGAMQWARADDGNALPWLHVLDDAQRRGDVAARDEALFRIAASRRLDERPYAAAAALADQAGAGDEAVLAAWSLGAATIGDDAGAGSGAGSGTHAGAAPPWPALAAACSGPPLADVNRTQLCQAVADLLLERSDSLDAYRTGADIAHGLGRDTVAIDAAVRRADGRLAVARADAWDCPRLRRDLARWQGGAAAGQVAMLR